MPLRTSKSWKPDGTRISRSSAKTSYSKFTESLFALPRPCSKRPVMVASAYLSPQVSNRLKMLIFYRKQNLVKLTCQRKTKIFSPAWCYSCTQVIMTLRKLPQALQHSTIIPGIRLHRIARFKKIAMGKHIHDLQRLPLRSLQRRKPKHLKRQISHLLPPSH